MDVAIMWLKGAHVTALAVWCAGLLVLPALYARGPSIEGAPALRQLESLTRFAFTHAISPAAFIAVGTGIALIFLREVFTAWMALKLAAVGALVLLHVRAGFVIVRVFDPRRSYASWRRWLTTFLTVAVILTILWLVLAKPAIDFGQLPAWLREPGALQSLLETMIPTP